MGAEESDCQPFEIPSYWRRVPMDWQSFADVGRSRAIDETKSLMHSLKLPLQQPDKAAQGDRPGFSNLH
jgi:hypothetical protein